MKNLITLCAIVVSSITACKHPKDIRSFIPGIYVNQSEGEYSIANDTLAIEALEGNSFLIHRKTSFQRIMDGKAGKREYETEVWNAIYNGDTKVLTETRKGKLLVFYPQDNKLLIGKRQYKKIGN